MMKFCEVCDNVLQKSTATGFLMTKCPICLTEKATQAEDSLMYEKFVTSGSSNSKYSTFITQASFDQTIRNVNKPCQKCGKKWTKRIRIGENETILDLCECGHVHGYK